MTIKSNFKDNGEHTSIIQQFINNFVSYIGIILTSLDKKFVVINKKFQISDF